MHRHEFLCKAVVELRGQNQGVHGPDLKMDSSGFPIPLVRQGDLSEGTWDIPFLPGCWFKRLTLEQERRVRVKDSQGANSKTRSTMHETDAGHYSIKRGKGGLRFTRLY